MSMAGAASLLRRSRGAVSRYYHGFRRSFATQTPEIGNQRGQQKQQLPWLLLSSPDNPESRYLYELTGDYSKPIAFNREIHLPEIAGHHLLGSSQGYLFSVDHSLEIHATDPMTGERLPVPSTAALPSVAGVFRDPAGNRTHYVIDNNEPPLDNIQPQTSLLDHSRRVGGGDGGEVSIVASLDPKQVDILDLDMMKLYYSRAILSPSLDTAVVIHQNYTILNFQPNRIRPYHRPAFARIGLASASASSSWNALYSPSYSFKDVIFHQGRLHAVRYSGSMVVFNLEDPLGKPLYSCKCPVDVHCLRGGIKNINTWRVFLVESPDGEDLFLVFAYSDGYPRRTCYCEVFKLDKSIYKWNQVNSIGDVAMFLGSNHSVAISANDSSAGAGDGGGIIRPNSIYFTDKYRVCNCDYGVGYIDKPEDVGDTGVYNLEDEGVEYYELSDGIHKFNWPSPIWFMPTTAR